MILSIVLGVIVGGVIGFFVSRFVKKRNSSKIGKQAIEKIKKQDYTFFEGGKEINILDDVRGKTKKEVISSSKTKMDELNDQIKETQKKIAKIKYKNRRPTKSVKIRRRR